MHIDAFRKEVIIWGVHHLGCRGVSVRFSSVGVGCGVWSFFCTETFMCTPKTFHFWVTFIARTLCS